MRFFFVWFHWFSPVLFVVLFKKRKEGWVVPDKKHKDGGEQVGKVAQPIWLIKSLRVVV
jgi:hypothetical protein